MANKSVASGAEASGKHAYIRLLGNFELEIDGAIVTDAMNRSHKMWNLLAYFVVHREKPVAQIDLIDTLWSDEGSDSPANALKTLLYRTRALLEPIIGPDTSLLLSRRGSYLWNPVVKCTVDTEEFEALCRLAADAARSRESRMEASANALALYRGDFLPKLSSELWVVPLSVHYHSLYLRIVKDYAKLLLEDSAFATLAEICADAIRIDSFDEQLHAMLVTAYLRQGNVVAALNHYESATELLYRNLGVRPSDELRGLYREIMDERKSLETDLGVIQANLREQEGEDGAFICEYGFFKEAYRLQTRRALRHGGCVHIGLMTVCTTTGEIPPLGVLGVVMDMLLEIIKRSLRRGDVVSRYSGAQYVFLLPTANFEDGSMVMNRIAASFNRQNRRPSIRLIYKLQQLELGAD